ncbi:unnamed protein product [Triticum turgidum subsp. durum]|uniref:Uncharacterized protein n=1 Tax=Triticum turgidum subsp. durum TaxID=4567 RepID=A0A9R0RS62_TRITD|nr:unnamed protein product [Triticum turgidum subsp. durum]
MYNYLSYTKKRHTFMIENIKSFGLIRVSHKPLVMRQDRIKPKLLYNDMYLSPNLNQTCTLAHSLSITHHIRCFRIGKVYVIDLLSRISHVS